MRNQYYYNGSKLLEKDTLLNFVNGGRGIGKTYFFKRLALKKYIENGERFVYLRRTVIETARIKEVLLDDICEDWWNNNYKVDGDKIYVPDFDGKYKEIMGYVLPLSVSLHYKSVPFNRVTTVIFDEYQNLDQKYLSSEIDKFLEFMSTVNRSRNDVRFYLLSNSFLSYNPYFDYFGVKLEKGQKFYSKNEITVDIPQNDGFIKEMEATKFGSLIKNTPYGDYNIKNKNYLENNVNISKKPKDAICMFNIASDDLFGVWYSSKDDLFYASKDTVSTLQFYGINLDHPNIYELNILKRTRKFKLLKEYYYRNKVRYTDLKVKGLFKRLMENFK